MLVLAFLLCVRGFIYLFSVHVLIWVFPGHARGLSIFLGGLWIHFLALQAHRAHDVEEQEGLLLLSLKSECGTGYREIRGEWRN